MAAGREAARRGGVRSATRQAALDGAVDPAFHRAILRIALELRRPGAGSYGEVVERTIEGMRLDAGAFRRYLGENRARNMSLLLSAARRLGP